MKLSIYGLTITTVIAPAFTMGLGSIFLWVFDTLPFIVSMDGSPTATRQLFGYTSFGRELWSSFGRLLYDVFLGPLVSVPFGFIGAAIFLAPSFAIASLRNDIRSYMVAGGLSGAAHAAGGIMLGPLLLGSYGGLGLVLGFTPYGFRQIVTVTTAVSAPAAGILAGYLYGRMVRPTSA